MSVRRLTGVVAGFAALLAHPVRAQELQPEAVIRYDPSSLTVLLDGQRWMNMTLVPPGEFHLGATATADSIARRFEVPASLMEDASFRLRVAPPARPVTISKGFWMGTTEVTYRQWETFIDATGYITDAERSGVGNRWNGDRFVEEAGLNWKAPGFEVRPDQPVTMVTWNDARAFAAWLGRLLDRTVRLPTEIEWEYAAKGGGSGLFGSTDDSAELSKHAWYNRGSDASLWHPEPVGLLSPNGFGLQDMLGNVWEWTADEFTLQPEPGQPVPSTEDGQKSLRGGSWLNGAPSLIPFYRASDSPDLVEPHFGFRIVMDR